MQTKEEKKKKTTCVTAQLDHETNQKLNEAALRSKRSKRAEMVVRLKDHLNKYPVEDWLF